MKLSSLDMVTEYRVKLKSLRAALLACGDGQNKVTCSTWHYGVEHNFCTLLGRARIKGELAVMLSHEIDETKRSLEAYGVEVDE